jgi:cellulose synthase (UDP-forming)
VLRRSAIESVGGFSTKTITEDMETSIVLHGRGWESVYHGETLAYGLSPASAGQYHVQRLRWGQGAMQILRKLNPLTYPGLTRAQRAAYFSSIIVYLDGPQKLVFYLAPVLFFLTGAIPVRTTDRALMVRLIPHLVLTLASFELLARGTGYLLISERYNMTKFFTYIMALSGFFIKKPIKFNVTPKGEGDVPWKTYAPQAAVAALSVASVIWAVFAYRYGWVDYHVSRGLSVAFVVNGFWVLWNLYFAVSVVQHSVKSRQVRADHRFAEKIPVSIRLIGADGTPGEARQGITRDFNATGLSFRTVEPFATGDVVEIPLALSAGITIVRGRVSHVEQGMESYGSVATHGVVFENLPIASRDAIELHCSHHAVPLWHKRYRESVDPVTNVIERLYNPRSGRRMRVELPALIAVRRPGEADSWTGMGLLEEVSRQGARLILENPIEPGSQIAYEVPGTQLRGQGIVVFSRAFESPMQVRFAVGVNTGDGKFSWRGLPIVRRFAVASLPRPA